MHESHIGEPKLKVLISPTNEHEALEAIAGGADIIDVKNPKEGSLGASFPWIIKKIRELTPNDRMLSCTLGDLPNLPGSVSLAAFGAAASGVDYIKVSLFGVSNESAAIAMLKAAVQAAKTSGRTIKVVAAGFADAYRVGSIDPLLLPKVADEAGCDVVMIDTAVKDGNNLLKFLTTNQLEIFIAKAHSLKLKAALAGSLQKEHLPSLCCLGTDIVGLRSAVCSNGDRLKGKITKAKVRKIVEIVRKAEIQCGKKA